MTMQTADVTQLKHDALDELIFHMTPKQWLTESGAWVLDRGEGAVLYDVEGREYSRRNGRGALRRPCRIRTGGDLLGDVRAGFAA
jgi:hypothetical protein